MARTRGADADDIAPVEEEVLGPEDADTEGDEGAPTDADEAGGDGLDGDDGDEPEADEEEAEGEDEVEARPAPRRGGGSATVRAQRRRAQEAEARTAALEREVAELRQIASRPAVDPAAAARAEQEWLAQLDMMTPAQAAQAVLERSRRENQQQLNMLHFQTTDRLDKQAYDATARTSKVHQQYRSQVEQVLASERAQGRNPDREIILKYLVGNDVLERGARAAPAQRSAAARRVNGQRTQPTGARGNVAPAGRRPAPGTPEHDDMLVEEFFSRGGRL
jgi:translation initiation factor IF-2